jgi:membrane protease YdiL (CAAX protease family)
VTTLGAIFGLLPAVLVPALLLVSAESLWPAVLAYHGLCLGVPLAFRCLPRDAGVVPATPRRWLPLTLAVCLLLLASAEAVVRRVDVKPLLPDGWEALLALAQPWWVFVAYSLLVNALLEEYFWRGFLLPRTGMIGGGVLFWVMHAAAGSVFVGTFAALVFSLPTLLAGILWGSARERFGTLWPCLLTHVAADAAILRVAHSFWNG